METTKDLVAYLKEALAWDLQKLRDYSYKPGEYFDPLIGLHGRLDDHHMFILDNSRRIDRMRHDLDQRLDSATRELSRTIYQVRNELKQEIERRSAKLGGQLDQVQRELADINRRLDSLDKVSVRRDDYQQLQERVARIENQVAELRQKVAA